MMKEKILCWGIYHEYKKLARVLVFNLMLLVKKITIPISVPTYGTSFMLIWKLL